MGDQNDIEVVESLPAPEKFFLAAVKRYNQFNKDSNKSRPNKENILSNKGNIPLLEMKDSNSASDWGKFPSVSVHRKTTEDSDTFDSSLKENLDTSQLSVKQRLKNLLRKNVLEPAF